MFGKRIGVDVGTVEVLSVRAYPSMQLHFAAGRYVHYLGGDGSEVAVQVAYGPSTSAYW